MTSPERQAALVAAHRAGDRRALGELAETVVGLARWVAGRYSRAGVDPEDLVGEAWLGFMDAVAGFDPARGSFSTYCTMYMRSRVRRAVTAGLGTRGSRAAFWGRSRAESDLAAAGEEPTDSAVAARLGVREEDVVRAAARSVALGEDLAADSPDLDDELDSLAAAARLRAAVGRLPPRLRFVMERSLEGHDSAATADLMGVSRQRVQQLRDRALAKLREEIVR